MNNYTNIEQNTFRYPNLRNSLHVHNSFTGDKLKESR